MEFFKLPNYFKVSSKPSSALIRLLSSVSLGTNGAQYRHLDTAERIKYADNPLYVSIERNDRVLGNITFCRRDKAWYIRYFAFDNIVQTRRNDRTGLREKNSVLKGSLESMFSEMLSASYQDSPAYLYAYIDPNNTRSLNMAEQFKFQKKGEIVTNFFSRKSPRERLKLSEIHPDKIEILTQRFSLRRNFTSAHVKRGDWMGVFQHGENEVARELPEVACQIQMVNWEINRLPGKWGAVLVRLLPYLPVLRAYVNPKKFSFLAIDNVYWSAESDHLLDDFLESLLQKYGVSHLVWWRDIRDEVAPVKNWGLLRRILGNPKVYIMERGVNPNVGINYVAAFDLI